MELIIKSRNGRITERQRVHIQEKMSKLERYLEYVHSATVEISSETRRNQKHEVYRLQVTLVGEHGIILRAEQSDHDMFRAIDLVQNVLQRQIKRYKEKHWRRGKLRRKSGLFVPSDATLAGEATADNEAVEETPRIMRVKEFDLKPMFSDEAVEQMELINHSFFIFRDADTSLISVVYRRNDGNYGLIVPEEIA
jgi:ribosomal subunit interface protein